MGYDLARAAVWCGCMFKWLLWQSRLQYNHALVGVPEEKVAPLPVPPPLVPSARSTGSGAATVTAGYHSSQVRQAPSPITPHQQQQQHLHQQRQSQGNPYHTYAPHGVLFVWATNETRIHRQTD